MSTPADGRNILFKTKDNQFFLSSNKYHLGQVKQTSEEKFLITEEQKDFIHLKEKSDSNYDETEDIENSGLFPGLKVVRRLNDKDFLFIPRNTVTTKKEENEEEESELPQKV